MILKATVGPKPRKLKSSAARVLFIHARADNAQLNVERLIQLGHESHAFGDVNWDDDSWDVEESERSRIRGHQQTRARLNFTQHKAKRYDGHRLGLPFQKNFADVVKAIIRLRRASGDQTASNQQQVIFAFRYLYDELQGVNFEISRTTRDNFDAAAGKIRKREKTVSADGRIGHLEEIAQIIDRNGLTPSPLGWRSSYRTRDRRSTTKQEKAAAGDLADPRMVEEMVLQALVELYGRIPQEAHRDRIRVGLTIILATTGLRIGEVLTLPAEPLRTGEDGQRYFIYFPEKGALPTKRWLLTDAKDIVAKVFDELLELTSHARAVAARMFEDGGKILIDGLDLSKPLLTGRAVAKAIGHVERTFFNFLKARSIPYQGTGVDITVRSEDLVKGLQHRIWRGPVATVKNSSEKLELHQCLTCIFQNQMHAIRPTLTFLPRPLSDGQLRRFLASTRSTKSIFEKYGMVNENGDPYNVRSHAFRHWLNSLLDEGGLSDAEQSQYFGRKDSKNNRSYQHMRQSERVNRARQALLEGKMLGQVADDIQGLPVDKAEVIVKARVQAVHLVPGGACFHSFSQSPCPRHLECQSGCGDFHWLTDDAVQKDELIEQRNVLEIATDTARREHAEGAYGADAWLVHNEIKLATVDKQLDSMAAAG